MRPNGLAFFLSGPDGTAKLPVVVKRPIPIGQRCVNAAGNHRGLRIFACALLVVGARFSSSAQQVSTRPPSAVGAPVTAVVNKYCLTCHDSEMKKGGLALDLVCQDEVTQHPDEWERVIRKLRALQMPPLGKDRPAERAYDDVVAQMRTAYTITYASNANGTGHRRIRVRAIREGASVRLSPTVVTPN